MKLVLTTPPSKIGCYTIMQSIKLVLDVGVQFIPGVGKVLDAGLGTWFHKFRHVLSAAYTL
jgi:hypothetical protein